MNLSKTRRGPLFLNRSFVQPPPPDWSLYSDPPRSFPFVWNSFRGPLIADSDQIIHLYFCLFFVLFLRKLMPTTAQLILIQWVLALLCLYTTFLFGIDYVTHPITCQVVAALLHFFTLAYICWTSVEALQMYFVIVQTMNGLPRARKFIPWSTAYAWGK